MSGEFIEECPGQLFFRAHHRMLSVPSYRWIAQLLSDPHEGAFSRRFAKLMNDGWQPIGGAYYSRGEHCVLLAKQVPASEAENN